MRLALIALIALALLPLASAQEAGLVGHWDFDEGSGTAAADSSPVGNPGTISGAVWTQGVEGSALSFDGIDDFVDLGTAPFGLSGDEMTVAAWFNPTNVEGYHYLFSRGQYISPFRLFLDGSALSFAVQTSGASFPTFPGAVTSGSWNHVAAVIGGGTYTLYLNGQQVAAGALSAPGPLAPEQGRALIGSAVPSGNPFEGAIDEVRIYNRALSASEVSALIGSAPLPPPPTPPTPPATPPATPPTPTPPSSGGGGGGGSPSPSPSAGGGSLTPPAAGMPAPPPTPPLQPSPEPSNLLSRATEALATLAALSAEVTAAIRTAPEELKASADAVLAKSVQDRVALEAALAANDDIETDRALDVVEADIVQLTSLRSALQFSDAAPSVAEQKETVNTVLLAGVAAVAIVILLLALFWHKLRRPKKRAGDLAPSFPVRAT